MKEPDQIEISTEELEALLGRVRSVLTEEDYQKLAAVVRTLGYVTRLLENREATLDTLRRLSLIYRNPVFEDAVLASGFSRLREFPECIPPCTVYVSERSASARLISPVNLSQM